MTQLRLTTALVLFAAVMPSLADGLDIGSPMPPLDISKWAKGEAVTLPTAGKTSEKVYLIELWATWCPPCIESIPHLTELQKKHQKDGLVVVGISDEPETTVQRFVDRQKDKMDYTVAVDNGSTTTNMLMQGVGTSGIPYAFIVGKDGRLAWHGHPRDPLMEETLDAVLDGSFSIESAKRRAEEAKKLEPLLMKVQQSVAMGEFPAAVEPLEEILKLDPSHPIGLSYMVGILTYEMEDAEGLTKFVDNYVRNNADNADGLNNLAGALMRVEEFGQRRPELMLQAAKAAYEACKGSNCVMLDTYARALYQIGNLDEAIRIQSDAVTKAGEGEKEAMEKILAYYQECKRLRDGGA